MSRCRSCNPRPPERLVRQAEGFTALATGYAAVIAVTGNTQIVDLVHLHIREPVAVQAVAIGVPGATPVRELSLGIGETEDLQALLLDANDVRLGGAFGHAWTSADSNVLEILAGAAPGRVQVSGVAAGTTTLTLGELTLGELTWQEDLQEELLHGEGGRAAYSRETRSSHAGQSRSLRSKASAKA